MKAVPLFFASVLAAAAQPARGDYNPPYSVSGGIRWSDDAEHKDASDAVLVAAAEPRLTGTPVGIVYTCDPAILALPGVCDTLNTTIAGIYSSTFTNANANIYVKFGTTNLASSFAFFNGMSYATFRNALHASITDPNDLIAYKTSVPSVNPIDPTYSVQVSNSLFRAFGFSPTVGVLPETGTCPIASAGCYDGVILISSSAQSAGLIWYRTGTIGAKQFDFYSLIQHETDEILHIGSCVGQCSSNGSTRITPSDLYRYQSNGARTHDVGNNNPCSAPNEGNACFSIDGVHMQQQWNNILGAGDLGDWVTDCKNYLVQDAQGCAGVANANISKSAEIAVLDAIGYTFTGSGFMVVDTVTSDVPLKAACTIPAGVAGFPASVHDVWFYVFVTGAKAGDSFSVNFLRPDGGVQTAANGNVASVGINGSFCGAVSMPVSGTSAASFPGMWTLQIFWNGSAAPVGSTTFSLAQPVITLVANAFGDNPLIAPNTWVEIKGANLAPEGDARIWMSPDFANNSLPIQMDGVSATVNGINAYVYFISAAQVNILTPPDTLSGLVDVQLTVAGAKSNVVKVAAQGRSLSLFEFVSPAGLHYIYGRHSDSSLIGPPGLFPTAPDLTVPVKPGESIYIAGNGFGPTDAPVISGALSQSGSLPDPLPVIKIGGVQADVSFAGLIAVGTYQINLKVPDSVPDGDLPLTAVYAGLSTQPNLLVTVKH